MRRMKRKKKRGRGNVQMCVCGSRVHELDPQWFKLNTEKIAGVREINRWNMCLLFILMFCQYI